MKDWKGFDTWDDFTRRVIESQKARLDDEAAKVLNDAGCVMPGEVIIVENNIGIKPGTVIRPGQTLAYGFFPPGIGAGAVEAAAGMYGDVDPLDAPLPKIADKADWEAKDRQIEWVRKNFTPGMLAKLYKLSYDADGLRRSACDEIVRKEKP